MTQFEALFSYDCYSQHLVSWQLLFHGFFLVGIFVSLFSLIAFFWCLQELGGFTVSDLFFAFTNWQDGFKGFTGDELNQFLIEAQSTCFVSIVIMQICKSNQIELSDLSSRQKELRSFNLSYRLISSWQSTFNADKIRVPVHDVPAKKKSQKLLLIHQLICDNNLHGHYHLCAIHESVHDDSAG